ncbi:hypothetical protein HG619_03825 [Pseudomonas syringae]|nr:hypothetical protein [Pseudomonas syringae]
MISSARLGDKHACPLPGHGTTPIASASGDVNINGMGAARVGDTCGCGAVITTGFPSILVNGRPMAHLEAPPVTAGQSSRAQAMLVAASSWATLVARPLLTSWRWGLPARRFRG